MIINMSPHYLPAYDISLYIIIEFIIPKRTVPKEFLSFPGNPFARAVSTRKCYMHVLMIQTYIPPMYCLRKY